MTDWPGIIGPVAEALLGEPTKRARDEWRYRTRGSLAVHVGGERAGTWRDWEADTGGGVLALVEHERGCDKAAALDWLESAGFVESRDRERPVRRPEPFPRSRTHERTPLTPKSRPGGAGGASAGDPTPDPADIAPDPRAALVAQLWARSVPADATPGRLYLALRLAWPPHGIGPDLPATVRWLAHEASPGSDRAAKWYGLPDGAAGALVFAWCRPGDADPDPRAVSMEAIGAAGERIEPRWRRTFGTRAGAVFEARAPRGGDSPVHVAEGEADALALALAPWCGAGGVYAAGGTAGMRTDPERFAALTSGPVVLHADDGEGGGGAAAKAQARIQATGRGCRVEWYRDGDPNDELAAYLIERAAIREFDGGATREDADRGAWHDLLSEVSNDGR